jgi:hypothetical protein
MLGRCLTIADMDEFLNFMLLNIFGTKQMYDHLESRHAFVSNKANLESGCLGIKRGMVDKW